MIRNKIKLKRNRMRMKIKIRVRVIRKIERGRKRQKDLVKEKRN